MFTIQVAAGAALLDMKRPGWREEIDTDRLDVQFYDTCILGQLYGEFDEGLLALGLTYDEAGEHGFCGAFSRYDVLTDEWIAFLTQ
jgi:hypothetical protein